MKADLQVIGSRLRYEKSKYRYFDAESRIVLGENEAKSFTTEVSQVAIAVFPDGRKESLIIGPGVDIPSEWEAAAISVVTFEALLPGATDAFSGN